MAICWISVRTLETEVEGRVDWTLVPSRDADFNETFFPVDDPFNTRKAVVPLFYAGRNGELTGLATAFGLDANGLLLTADHAISDFRQHSELSVSDRL